MPAPTSSLRFAGQSFIQPRIAGSPSPNGMGFSFNNAQVVTLAFWLKVNALPTGDWAAPVSFYAGSGMFPRVTPSGTIAFDLATRIDGQPYDMVSTPAAPVNLGSADHWLAVFDGQGSGRGTLTVYRNGVPALSTITSRDGPNYFYWYQILALGNIHPVLSAFRDGDVEVADVAFWNGYAGTLQDAVDLTERAKRPSDIATPQRLIHITGDGGTAGEDVGPTDAGILSTGHADFASNEGFTYDFRSYGGDTGNSNRGSIRYAAPLSYSPPVVATAYIPASGEGFGLLFAKRGGQKAHIPKTTTRAALWGPGGAPTLTIHRSGGGTDTVTLDENYAYFSNAFSPDAGGAYGQDWLYIDLRGQGVARIGPNDTAHVSAARHWINATEGYCDAIDADASRASPLPAVPGGRKALRVGYNLEPPFAFNLPYYGNMARWMDDCIGRFSNGGPNWGCSRDANGLPRPGLDEAGSYAEGNLLNPDGVFGSDVCGTRGMARDNTGNEQYVNAYFDNPAAGTEGFKLGNGFRVIPKRGKIHLAWDYLPGHDGDGTASIRLGINGDDVNPDITGGSPYGPQVYSWTWNPTIHAGTGGTNYYRTYEYVGNDPINGLGATGARLTPQLRLRWTGFACNFRVTVEADSDLPEAVYNVDKFDPPLFHPYLADEVLRDVDTIRIMNWANAYDTGLSDASQFTPYGHYTWGTIFSGLTSDQGYPTGIGIASCTPFTEPEATALRTTYAGVGGGGCPMKITTVSPHNLADGASFQIQWGSSVTFTCVSDQDGQTYNVNMATTSWIKPVRVLSPTELLTWAWFDQPGGGYPYGILSRTYSGGELGGAYVEVKRERTLPLRAVGELAARCGANVHYSLPYAVGFTAAKAAAWADAVAPYFPADRELYVEVGNEIWNDAGGRYIVPLNNCGDELGLVDGQHPSSPQEYAQHVRVTARAAKAIRQRWAAHGLDPGKVKCLINSGPGSWLPYAIPVIQQLNASGDPLLRVDEVAPNTYWGNFGDEENMAAFPGFEGLDIEQTLDIFELRVSRGNYSFVTVAGQRAALDAAGLADVELTSYEGGSDRIVVGYQESVAFDHADLAAQTAFAKLGLLQLGVFRNPRWAGILNASLTRLQGAGLVRQTRYVATAPPWPGFWNPGRTPSRYWWTSYLSMEPSGKGDGSDGKWDNRISAERPYGPYAEGDSVNVDGYAIKAWNAASGSPTDATVAISGSVAITASASLLTNHIDRSRNYMIDWASLWAADSAVAAASMANGDALTGDPIDLDSKSAVELGFTITKSEGSGTISVLMLNAVDASSYESPGAATNFQVFSLLPGAGTEHYRVQFDARTMSQAKPHIKVSLGNNGIYNAQVVRISSITMKTRTGVEV